MNNHGLNDLQLNAIKKILAPFASKIQQVGLFGSRATGAYRLNSDIDLVVYGNLNEAEQNRLYTLFKDSNLSINVDVNVYHLITYPPLKQHIDEACQILFAQCDLV